jgi:DNA/RNA-binding domain of Phe-tRNA-synthetase-like protein
MTEIFAPSVSPEIFDLRPDYCALNVVAHDVDNSSRFSDEPMSAGGEAAPAWAEAHLEAWRSAYRAFGAKPQRTPCSAEALRKRVEASGQLPRINAAVDLYNALSLRYAIPVGGENIAAYRGTPRLVRAVGDELFDTVKDGEPYSETVSAGEVIWRDALGATCRRWNWRQGVRTRIDEATREMWFVLERLAPMPIEALIEAGKGFAVRLATLSPSARITSSIIDRTGTSRLVDNP